MSVNYQNHLTGKSTIHCACKGNVPGMLPIFYNLGPDYELKDNNGKTPLDYLKENSNKEMIETYNALYAKDINEIDDDGNSFVHKICAGNVDRMFEFLLTDRPTADFLLENNDGVNPMHLLKTNNNKEMYKEYLNAYKETSVNYQRPDGNSALHLVCMTNNPSLMTDFVLVKPDTPNFNLENNVGKTPMDYLKGNPYPIMMETYNLIYTKDPYEQDKDGNCALHKICSGVNAKMFELYPGNKFDYCTITNKDGKTPYDILIEVANGRMVERYILKKYSK